MNFILQAYKGKISWWIWLVASLIVLHSSIVGIYSFLENYDPEFKPIPYKGDTNLVVAYSLGYSVVMLLVLFLCVRFLHKRSIKTVITSRVKIDWLRFFVGLATWGLVAMVFLSVAFLANQDYYIWQYNQEKFLVLLAICLLILPIQSSFTEIFFRGYLLQGFSIWLKRPWLGLVFSTLLFTLVNSLNPEVFALGFNVVVFYVASAMLKGVITILDEGVELAMGINTINNFIALVYVTSDWSILQTNAVLLDTSPPSSLYMVYLPVFLFFPIYFYLLCKIFKWKNWKEKLFGTVEKPL